MSNKSTSRKSWQEKLADSKGLPKVEEITDKMSKRWGTGTVVIPAPKEVDEIMRQVPRGKLITINEIRAILARKAHAAEEAAAEGKQNITPYWRTLKTGGELNEKYPGGVEAQETRLKEERHIIEPSKGKRPPKVKGFENHLVRL